MALKIMFVNPNLKYFTVPNLGLAYVMSKAEQRYQVKLLDLTFHAREVRQHIARVTSGYSPDIVAFSVNSFTLDDGLTIARLIRERFRHAKFIWGGIHPTLFPEEMINHPLVDGICIGE